jgi:hypothetical protein
MYLAIEERVFVWNTWMYIYSTCLNCIFYPTVPINFWKSLRNC